MASLTSSLKMHCYDLCEARWAQRILDRTSANALTRMLDLLPQLITYIRHWKIETWTAIVAVIALIQPWIVALFKRLFVRVDLKSMKQVCRRSDTAFGGRQSLCMELCVHAIENCLLNP